VGCNLSRVSLNGSQTLARIRSGSGFSDTDTHIGLFANLIELAVIASYSSSYKRRPICSGVRDNAASTQQQHRD
jgi:hypothetical protein